jgi:hypothetical protein
VCGLNARFAAGFEKALQPFVSKALDHVDAILVCSASGYKL